jgi:hypothetical protein
MRRFRVRTPSPAMVVAITALVFAVAGTAVAGVATISSLNKKEKKQTRNIADSEITKKAPGLSVANADSVGGRPLRTALVAANGTVDAAHSDGVSQANVTEPVGGVYCFDGLSPVPHSVVASIAGGSAGIQTQITIPGQSACAGKQFSVGTVNDANALVPDTFFVFIH